MRWLIILLFLTSSIYANDYGDYDFRRTRWNMTVDQVDLSESKNKEWTLETFKKQSADRSVMAYTGFLLNNRCLLLYNFKDGKLDGAAYVLQENKYSVSVYEKLIDVLNLKYGGAKIINKNMKGLQWLSEDQKTFVLLVVAGGIQVLYVPYNTNKITVETDQEVALDPDDF